MLVYWKMIARSLTSMELSNYIYRSNDIGAFNKFEVGKDNNVKRFSKYEGHERVMILRNLDCKDKG